VESQQKHMWWAIRDGEMKAETIRSAAVVAWSGGGLCTWRGE
jgi:hypothetical protein